MGNLLKGLSASDIVTINHLEYDDAASAVGKVDGFAREQLEAWATKAKQVGHVIGLHFFPYTPQAIVIVLTTIK